MRTILLVMTVTILSGVGVVCGRGDGQLQTVRADTEKEEYMTAEGNRPTTLAGTWYPSGEEALHTTIEQYFRHVKQKTAAETVVGIIAPHAGYQYSGQVAAAAYKQVEGKTYDTVVVIAPNHVDPSISFSSVLTGGSYETPLGTIPVDGEIAGKIVSFDPDDTVRASEKGHLTGYGGRMEHSLEIQLPFLQEALGDFRLVPVIMGDQRLPACRQLAQAIADAAEDNNVLLVASSDLSHFYTGDQADRLDAVVEEYIESFDPEGLLKDATVEKARVCGKGTIATVMMAAKKLGAGKADVLVRKHSGDVTGDADSVVGYLAAVVTSVTATDGAAESEAKAHESAVGVELGLTAEEKDILREVVSTTLETVVNGGEVPRYDNFNGNLGQKRGAFVTLNKNGSLRGCIGNIIGQYPLITTVAHMTRSAALEDPRFPPVKSEELDSIEFEISVLTPIRDLENIDDIAIGRDGLIISRGMRRGLLLPQVPVEYGWDRETFLQQTCRKAGLPMNAWQKPDTRIEVFSAEVFR